MKTRSMRLANRAVASVLAGLLCSMPLSEVKGQFFLGGGLGLGAGLGASLVGATSLAGAASVAGAVTADCFSI